MEWAVGCWDRRRKFQICRGEKENGVSHGVLGSAGKRNRWRGESENGVGCGLWRRWDRRKWRPAEESGEREKSKGFTEDAWESYIPAKRTVAAPQQRRWNHAIFNVLEYGAKGNGYADDTKVIL
uniref:Uncharacterized protein n=1 Tax=Fagus sylvatica TaxID=28930 RepID=A0A2N9IZF8_FAGSY